MLLGSRIDQLIAGGPSSRTIISLSSGDPSKKKRNGLTWTTPLNFDKEVTRLMTSVYSTYIMATAVFNVFSTNDLNESINNYYIN